MKIELINELSGHDPNKCGWCHTLLVDGKCPREGCEKEQEQNFREYQDMLIEEEKNLREGKPSPFNC